MPGPRVKLSSLVDALDMQGDEASTYLDRLTGEVVVLSEEDEAAAEDEELAAEAPAWQRSQIELAREVESDTNGRFVPLPDRFDVDEWRMMSDFAASVEDEHAGSHLVGTIRGSGAFRRFKDTVDALGLRDQWFEYREQRYRELAKEWCEEQGIEWEDDRARR